MAKQITLNPLKQQILKVSAAGTREKLDDMSYYATHTALTGGGKGSGVDTGAYVTSFSLVPAGTGGGRSRTSSGKPRNRPEEEMKALGYEQMQSDIARLDVEGMLESGKAKITIRNRAPHARQVEDGWPQHEGYAVFAKLKREFG